MHIARPAITSPGEKRQRGEPATGQGRNEENTVLEIIEGFINSFTNLVQLGITLLALVFVGMTWARTRSLAPTIGALVLGAVVIWGVYNMSFLQTQVGEDIQEQGG